MSWDKIAKLFDMMATIYRGDGLIDLPEFGALPSPEIDAACDVYCREIAVDLRNLKDPPEEIRGWMWVRAVCVAAFAQQLSTDESIRPEILDAKLVEQLLIVQWYVRLRSDWSKLVDWTPSGPSRLPPNYGKGPPPDGPDNA
jgi:hypothetical protein